MYEALSATNEAVLRARDAAELYQQVCDAAIQSGALSAAAVCELHPADGRISAVALAGTATRAEAAALQLSTDADSPYGKGLVGTALREGKTSVSNDLLADERLQ